jgi:hypothetical protein
MQAFINQMLTAQTTQWLSVIAPTRLLQLVPWVYQLIYKLLTVLILDGTLRLPWDQTQPALWPLEMEALVVVQLVAPVVQRVQVTVAVAEHNLLAVQPVAEQLRTVIYIPAVLVPVVLAAAPVVPVVPKVVEPEERVILPPLVPVVPVVVLDIMEEVEVIAHRACIFRVPAEVEVRHIS